MRLPIFYYGHMPSDKSISTTRDLIRFIDSSPTASHAASEAARLLDESGFKPLDETEPWDLHPGNQRYLIRDHSAIIAFRVGSEHPQDSGFRIIGAHTDFPGLRLKPNAVYSKAGYVQLGVEVYGGPIVATWTDRDLGLAGRIILKTGDSSIQVKLVRINRPMCRIPNLAIHMNRDVNENGLKLNVQDNLPPIIGMGDDKFLEELPLKKLLAESAGVDVEKIVDYRIEIVDIQPGAIGGIDNAFVFSGRIDNLASCHASIEALRSAPKDAPFTQVVALFDNEEVGSQTPGGAGSRLLDHVLERLCIGENQPREAFFRATAKSFMISCDGAHAVNPNYPEAHDPKHQPMLNGGPVLKVNAQERYTSEIEALAHLQNCAERAGIKLQTFVARTDKPCGSTIGPMTAARLGIRSVDIGTPMLSMHSIRETGGVEDQAKMLDLMGRHFTV
jgi:aspartyl aminopeptidase